jgi:hypothetical protein
VNSFLTQIAFQIQDVAVRPYVYSAVKSLEASGNATAQLLASSIRDAFHGSIHDGSVHRIEAIETLRTRLNRSKENIEIVDYGAGADSDEGSIVHRTIGDVALSSSKPYRWSLLLFSIVETMAPKQCLEFGTCLGISTLYQAAALAQNNAGSMVTMEGSQALAAVAQKNFSDLGYGSIVSLVGKFDDVLPSVLKHYDAFDHVFIDGHHDGNATMKYFERLLPSLTNNAVVVFDDIHWSSDMKHAWKKIITHPRIKFSADLYQVGIVIVS